MSSQGTIEERAAQLAADGVAGVVIAWADNNGIPRARVVPIAALPDVAARGIGVTALFAVFDSHDAITNGHEGLATASGDRRLVPVVDRLQRLAGQPHLAWAPGQQRTVAGAVSEYDQRAVLERQIARAAEEGIELRAGYEIGFTVHRDAAAHDGPAYSARALIAIDDLVSALLRDLAANGLELNQLHAEYGAAQVELSLAARDPLRAADDQLLARQTIHAAAAALGYRVSFAPLTDPAGIGNGWHLHVSPWRDGRNLLAPTGSGDVHGLGAEGASFLAGLLAHLPAISAITAPSVPSRLRLRPGYFAGAYTIWGIENREATLRVAEGGALVGDGYWNVELKASDASGNPYLALAAVISAGLDGVRRGTRLAAPVDEEPSGWTDEQRRSAGAALLPQTTEEALVALGADTVLPDVLGRELLGAFRAVRRSDAAWADDRTAAETVDAHRWRY